MPDYGNYCPIAIATDVIADRWTPLILRELVLGNTRFNDIARGLPGISRSLLVQRLKHLERKGVIETWPLPNGRGSEYHLTPAGKDLEPVLIVMGRWSVAWMYSNLDSTDVDAITLMWWMHRRVDVGRLPHDRVVIQFDHPAPKPQSFWVLIKQGAAAVFRRCGQVAGGGGGRRHPGEWNTSRGELDAALVPVEPVGERDAFGQ